MTHNESKLQTAAWAFAVLLVLIALAIIQNF